MSLGWGQRSRRRVRCAGRGAGSTGTPEQAGRGGRSFLQVLWAGGGHGTASADSGERSRERLGRGAFACHCSLFVGTLLPAKASSVLLWAPPAASGRRGQAGLGEVERFIPGEQAAGERRGCQSRCRPPVGVPALRGLDTGPRSSGVAARRPFAPTLDAAAPEGE